LKEHHVTKPFPFPDGYWLDPNHKLSDRSLKDYVALFLQSRHDRPGGTFADVDIEEMMRLAEDLDSVESSESKFLLGLVTDHPDYFRDVAQRRKLETFARTHEAIVASSKNEFTKELLESVPVTFYRTQAGIDFLGKAQALSDAVKANDDFYSQHGAFDAGITQQVNATAAEISSLVDGFTLTDVDAAGGAAHVVFLRDVANLLARTTGHTDHEAKWENGKWSNWNRDIEVYPVRYEQPGTTQEIQTLLQTVPGLARMVAGGHAFNIGSSMGGTKQRPLGTLITLDRHMIGANQRWRRVDAQEAIEKYNVDPDQAKRIVRASAGIRLRDFGKMMWAEGMALPVAGSTDAQSLGGLIASDLHSTGKTTGFLSPQLLEVSVIVADGKLVTFTKNEAVARGQLGRWSWIPPDTGAKEPLSHLPVAGAIGTLGIVTEIVIKLDAAYHMSKLERLIPRNWAETNFERLLDTASTDPLVTFDHVSFYYAGGGQKPIKTVRLNAWKRTTEPISRSAAELKTVREVFDIMGSGLLPDYLLRLSERQSTSPDGQPAPGDDDWIAKLNKLRRPLVFQANEAFARKLFFQHDEIEVGIPIPAKAGGGMNLDVARNAIEDTMKLLSKEEFKTIIEVRFTPDLSEGMLGPGTGGPTCYIELATALGEFSKARIAEVYDKFDRLMRDKYHSRPHLGKKTSADYAYMSGIYGSIWDDFQTIRARTDPNDRFLPADNTFLRQVFRK